MAEFKDSYLNRFIEEDLSQPVIVISAVRGDGITELLGLIAQHLEIDLRRVKADFNGQYLDGEPPEGLKSISFRWIIKDPKTPALLGNKC